MKDQVLELNFTFDKRLTVSSAEIAVSRMGWVKEPKGPIRLDLSQCEHVDVGAGWLLGNALRRYAEHFSIRAIVPPPTRNLSDRWFLEFTRSGLGFSLARYASCFLLDGQEVTETIRAYYSVARSRHLEDSHIREYLWTGQNFCLVSSLERGVLDPESEAAFGDLFARIGESVSLDVALYDDQGINELVRLAFEAIQNVYDHANKRPLAPGTGILSYLSMRYYKDIKSSAWDDSLKNYLTRPRASPPRGLLNSGWVEIIVNDDGVGVAARMSKDPAIYWGSGEGEVLALTRGLSEGGSIKLDTQELVRGDPGYGFSKIVTALKALDAFALLRSGKRSVVFDSTGTDAAFRISSTASAYMPGTALQVILPRRQRSKS